MTKMITIKFDDNPDGVYYCGQVVSGKIQISLVKARIVRGIAIQIRGFAKARWDEKWSDKKIKKRSVYYDYYGKEEYISCTKYVVGSNDNACRVELPAGNYTHKFSYSLSNLLPSSYEGTHGHIRYQVKLIIDRPWKFDKIYSAGFTVLRQFDLNMFAAQFRLPAEYEKTQTFGIGIFKSNQLNIKVNLNKVGFVPGEIIPIHAVVNNGSNVDITEVRFVLRTIISYHANKNKLSYKEEIINLITKTSGQVARKSCMRFEKNLLVPPVPPSSNTNHSKIIEINYDIKVEAVTTKFHKNAFVVCPIAIGTVPLVEESHQSETFLRQSGDMHPQPQQSDISIVKVGTSASSLSARHHITNTEPLTPPPSYEYAIHIMSAQVDTDDDIDDDHDDIDASKNARFVPKYPVYHLEETPPSGSSTEI